jgi:hypothetical protein
MDRRWASAFIKHGKIRIGTLYSFRNVESHGDQVGDSKEGTKQIRSKTFKHLDTDKWNEIPYWMKQGINVESPGASRDTHSKTPF